MNAEGYPGELIDTVKAELSGHERIIDIGAGTGLFAIPLARSGHRITAIEPSAEMVRIFTEKLLPEDFPRIDIHTSTWDQWRSRRHDAALCAHSIYGMSDITRALEKMRDSADRTVLLVRCDNESTTLSGMIKQKLGENTCSKDFVDKVTSALSGIGIAYTVRTLIQKRFSRFADIAGEAEYFARHTGAGDKSRETIAAILAEYAHQTGSGYEFENIYSDRMIVF
jgi:ubiquinone/menaquinone biosynthesis C-methylase UbiE